MKLTCTVTPAESLVGMIVFVRHTNNSRLTCGEIKQYPDSCSRYFETGHCHVSCGSGTNTRASRVKKYTLDILDMKEVDYTTWSCEMQNVTTKFATVTLKQESKQKFSLMEASYANVQIAKLVNQAKNIVSVNYSM